MLRAANSNNSNNFNNVNTSGTLNNNNANNSNGVAPDFCDKAEPVKDSCLLAFFLGGIGIHKFYVGKIGAGILFILFCWTFIPSFIAFIELIVGLCKKADANGNILV